MESYRRNICLGQAEFNCRYRYYPDVNLDDEQDNEHVELMNVYCGSYDVYDYLNKETLDDLEDHCLSSHHG